MAAKTPDRMALADGTGSEGSFLEQKREPGNVGSRASRTWLLGASLVAIGLLAFAAGRASRAQVNEGVPEMVVGFAATPADAKKAKQAKENKLDPDMESTKVDAKKQSIAERMKMECSLPGDDCSSSKCCRDFGYRCFAKKYDVGIMS